MGREKPTPVVMKEPCCKCGSVHEREEKQPEPEKFEDAQETINVIDSLLKNTSTVKEPDNSRKTELNKRLMELEEQFHHMLVDTEILEKKGIKIGFDCTKARIIKACIDIFLMVEWCDIKEKLWKMDNNALVPSKEFDLIQKIKKEAKEWNLQCKKLFSYVDWLICNWKTIYSIKHVALGLDPNGIRYSELEYFIQRVDDVIMHMKSENNAGIDDYQLGFQNHKDTILAAITELDDKCILKIRMDEYAAFERHSLEIDIMDNMRVEIFEEISTKLEQILQDFNNVTVPEWLDLLRKIMFPTPGSQMPPPQTMPPKAPLTGSYAAPVAEEKSEKKGHVCTRDKIMCVINNRLGDPVNMLFIWIIAVVLVVEVMKNPYFFLPCCLAILIAGCCCWYNANWDTFFPEKALNADPKK